MKVDFHCHTIKTEKDTSSRTIKNPSHFLSEVYSANVKAVVITNHNVFELEQYEKILQSKDSNDKYKDILIIPGIELDIYNDDGNEFVNCNVFTNPVHYNKFSQAIKKILETNQHPTIKDIKIFKEYFDDSLYFLFDYKNTSKAKKELSIELSVKLESIFDKENIFFEPAKTKRDEDNLKILLNDKKYSLFGTDNHTWEDGEYFKNNHFFETSIKFIKFDDLMHAVKNKYENVTYQLSKNLKQTKINDKITILENNVNVIIGDKGSGKTDSLKTIFKKYSEILPLNKINAFFHEKDLDKDDEEIIALQKDYYKNWIDVNNIDYSELVANSCEKELKDLMTSNTIDNLSLKDYVKYEENKENSKIRYSITSWNPYDGEQFSINTQDDKANYVKALKAISFLETFNKQVLENKLEEKISAIKEEVIKTFKETFISKNKLLISKKYSSDLIKFIKNNLSKFHLSNLSKPNIQLFEYYSKIKNDLASLSNIQNELNNFGKEKDIDSYEIIDKGIVIKTEVVNYKKDKLSIRGRITAKEYKKFIDSVENSVKYKCVKNILTAKQIIVLNKITNLTEFVNKEYKFRLVDKEDNTKIIKANYTLSSGERHLFEFEKTLFNPDIKYDVIIIDEPEISLNSYSVQKTIFKWFKDLNERNKTVVLATHNSNLATLLMPWRTFYTDYDNANFNVFTGCQFWNTLEDNNGNKKIWNELALKYLEGGDEPFKERSNIYGK